MVAAARRPGGDARSGRSGGSARAHDGEAGRRGGAGLRPAGASEADPDADAVAGEVKAPTAHQDRLKRQREVRCEAVPLVAQSDLGNAVVAFVQSCWSEQGQCRGRDPPGGRWRLASDGPSPARAPWCRDSCKRVGLRWATRPRRCGPVRRCATPVARSDQPEVLPAPPVLLATPVVLGTSGLRVVPSIAAGSVLSSLQLSQAGSSGGSGAGERGEAAAWSARSAPSRCWLVAGGGRGSC